MTREAGLPSALVRWVDDLQMSPLGDFTVLLVKGLQMWGFVLGQALWMVAPFIEGDDLAAIADALEDEASLEALYARVVDGDAAKGAVQGR